MNRRHIAETRQRRTAGAGLPAGCSPRRRRAALSAGVPARRLRFDQSADSLFEQLLLRGTPDHRDPRPTPQSSTSALALDADWALAPAVRDTIGAMYQQRQVAFVPLPAPTICRAATSRPRTASNSASRERAARNYRSGFLGRLSDTLLGSAAASAPIAFTDALPLAFEGRDGAEPVAQERRQAALR
jgi:hypothetical protein